MLDERRRGAAGSRAGRRPITCEECTIQIGEGFQETIVFEFLDETVPNARAMQVCWRCWESLNRRKVKRQAQEPPEPLGTFH
jgi:hypothetical protein